MAARYLADSHESAAIYAEEKLVHPRDLLRFNCIRTMGGHRRFPIEAVQRALREGRVRAPGG